MKTGFQQIGENEIRLRTFENVCWDDSSLVDAIFYRTAINVEGQGRVSGYGLRVLMSCCSAPASHLELALLGITLSVPMPLEISFFSCSMESGQLRFGFFSGPLPYKCRFGFYRFINLSYEEAAPFYRSPAVMEPGVGQLAKEGYSAFETPGSGQIVVSGKPEAPKLFVQAAGSEGSEIVLDGQSAKRLLDSIHYAGTMD